MRRDPQYAETSLLGYEVAASNAAYLGKMRLAPRTNVDPDELYYTAEQVRLNGEFWPDFKCYSEYFTSAEVTLISGSDVLQATR